MILRNSPEPRSAGVRMIEPLAIDLPPETRRLLAT